MALEDTLRAYGAAMRWGYFDSVYGIRKVDEREPVPESLTNIKIMSYDVVQPPVLVDDDTAVQVVKIEYVLKDVQHLRDLSDRQVWRWDPKRKEWLLDSKVPEFN